MEIAWKVSILPSARRELEELPEQVRSEAMRAIIDPGEDPSPQGAVVLRGHPGLRRIRVWRDHYRIVYRVSENQRKVVIWRVRPRGTAYRGLTTLGLPTR